MHTQIDVLIIGGGPAGLWAGIAARRAGARVALVDKGYCGTSGATAPSGTGVWYVPPDPSARTDAVNSRLMLGGRLQHRAWMNRVLDTTWDTINEIAGDGYAFPVDREKGPRRTSLQGPDYMRFMRKRAKAAGVRILDHSPALSLLQDAHGRVAGATGVRRQGEGQQDWRIEAGAVVMATGGCAFLSKALGCNVLTGDGYLMGGEAGASLSGMEFSNAYAIAPAFSSVTKTLFYDWATFTDSTGKPIPGASSKGGRSVIARHLGHGPVFARIDQADGAVQAAMRAAQPNFFLPFDRLGINPFTSRFPITLRLEGTVRGTGGLRIAGTSCETTVPGLYAAGDAATRELVCGAFTGGGSHNAAWALSSGQIAGQGAAAFALGLEHVAARVARPVAALREDAVELDAGDLIQRVQAEVFPFEINYFRSEKGLVDALGRLDTLWSRTRGCSPGRGRNAVRGREALSMLATARWMYRSALARQESRGMHRRLDFPDRDTGQQRHVVATGCDEIVMSHARAGIGFENTPTPASREVHAP